MNHLQIKIKTFLANTPKNGFLLFLTGFFFSQFMLINILYTKHPFGGWETSLGNFTNTSIFAALLLMLSVCLFALWRTTDKKESRSKNKRAFIQAEPA